MRVLSVRRPSFSILESVIETAICLHSAETKWRTRRKKERGAHPERGDRASVKVVHHHWRRPPSPTLSQGRDKGQVRLCRYTVFGRECKNILGASNDVEKDPETVLHAPPVSVGRSVSRSSRYRGRSPPQSSLPQAGGGDRRQRKALKRPVHNRPRLRGGGCATRKMTLKRRWTTEYNRFGKIWESS